MSQSRQQSLCQGVCSSTPRRRASRPFCTRAISSPPEPPSLLARYPILVRHVDYWSHYCCNLEHGIFIHKPRQAIHVRTVSNIIIVICVGAVCQIERRRIALR